MEQPPAPTPFSDHELVMRVLGGERAHYAELIQRHQSRLRAILSFYLHSPEELEERLQETFVQAFINLRSCQSSQGFFPWLKGIALNSLRMELRRLHSSHRRAEDYFRLVQLQRLASDPQGVVAETRAESLRGCLAQLPAPEAELIHARYAEDLSVRQLSQRFNSSEGALKVRLLRIRSILRTCILRQQAQAERA